VYREPFIQSFIYLFEFDSLGSSGGLVAVVVAYAVGVVVGGGRLSGVAFDWGIYAGNDSDAQRRLLCERCGGSGF
jgi:hypothetical protein